MEQPQSQGAQAQSDKATKYADAIIETLHKTASELGEPDINAALAALTFAQAYLIAKLRDRNVRRQAERQVVDNLGRIVAQEVNARILTEAREGSVQ